MESATLFSFISRDRPEWVAQGAFAYALRHDAGVRRCVLQRIWPVDAPALAAIVPAVAYERRVGKWRADVVATWPGREAACFELKLGAGLTPRQVEELGRRCDALVHPHKRVPRAAKGIPRLTWAELSSAASDPVLALLLGQVDASSSWWQEHLDAATLEAEFESFVRKKQWPKMYRFLATVDALLSDELGVSYRPSAAWAMSRIKPCPYYGFAFRVHKQKRSEWYFVGFYREKNALGVALTRNPASKDLVVYSQFPLDASRFAKEIATKVRSASRRAA